jgi:transcriptional regulator with XRE-family HTH domain
MKKSRNLIGPAIRKLRYQKGLSQPQLVAKCQVIGWNISRDILAAIEGQARRVTDAEIVLFAAVLRVSASLLLPDKKEALRYLRKEHR